MKKLSLTFFTVLLCFGLTSCNHEHTWSDATCTSPKTCTDCGETEGEALGHSWVDATCTTPKTCSVCGETEGEALGHSWVDATCTTPKTCSVCGETEGEALRHSWKSATCTTPKTCTRCNEIGGDALGHSWKDATCTTPKTCTRCNQKEGNVIDHVYSNGICIYCGKINTIELTMENYTDYITFYFEVKPMTSYNGLFTPSLYEDTVIIRLIPRDDNALLEDVQITCQYTLRLNDIIKTEDKNYTFNGDDSYKTLWRIFSSTHTSPRDGVTKYYRYQSAVITSISGKYIPAN